MKKVTLMLITVCLLLPMGQSMAKKPTCPGHQSCGGDDDTPLPVSEVNNTSEHSGLIFEDATAGVPGHTEYDLAALPRFCLVEIIQLNKGVVHYECDPGGMVSINFSDWETVSGDPGYCALLDTANGFSQKYREFTPIRYWYRNDSECDRTPGGVCEIRITKISVRGQLRGPGTHTGDTHQYFNLGAYGLENVGRIIIRNWAQLVPLEDDGNVFAVGHAMNLQYIEVEFRAGGNDVTICRVEQGTDYLPGEAQLITTDLP